MFRHLRANSPSKSCLPWYLYISRTDPDRCRPSTRRFACDWAYRRHQAAHIVPSTGTDFSILSRLPSVFPLSLSRKSQETHPTIRVQRFAAVVSIDPANPPCSLPCKNYYNVLLPHDVEYDDEKYPYRPSVHGKHDRFDNWRFDIEKFFTIFLTNFLREEFWTNAFGWVIDWFIMILFF